MKRPLLSFVEYERIFSASKGLDLCHIELRSLQRLLYVALKTEFPGMAAKVLRLNSQQMATLQDHLVKRQLVEPTTAQASILLAEHKRRVPRPNPDPRGVSGIGCAER